MGLHERAVALEHDSRLDGAIERIEELLPATLRSGPVHDHLAGRWLGHALHPVLTDVPLGTWMSATLLDLMSPRARHASELLKGVGLVAAVPTAASGLVEWQHADRPRQRVATTHALLNSGALGAYAASLFSSVRRHRGVATSLAVFGGALAIVGGYLGGHLSFARGVGVDPDGRRGRSEE